VHVTLALLIALVTTTDAGVPSCRTVKDCWLDPSGTAIARPKKFTGWSLPRPDCGKNLLWLRYQLQCVDHVCTSTFRGDAC